ncbi:MBOAT, membrane-bound O-acyltransferase family-domain-containing protein [Thamnocephalis sphaerospora]|uniref:MBOAT, membrane-bound O-acyltransferase family-domain-containing protein n=1 Tax=Thamnocephalis sphaerospora TaxID=78915 RepID=A0A4P9XR52_9FUNG|nr:MBOAT, membrane-bound O-acyltransferase family-domain-containing protein [Thamnocephalis sphaerospora]|eukprot:RKP08545.1 MBOAT, membrane-bound O-acyltransferase family-domain-containing protein [Thamnocephalis sphaerospora]
MRERSPHSRIELTALAAANGDAPSSPTASQPNGTPADTEKHRLHQNVQPSRWNTKEFYVYYFLFFTIVPYMIWTACQLSSDKHPNYPIYQHTLSQGWLFGRKLDNTDLQYRQFRANIPVLCLVAVIYVAISQFLDRFSAVDPTGGVKRNAVVRRTFYLLSSATFMTVICGVNIVKILAIVSTNYAIAKLLKGSRLNPLVTWAFNLAVLLFNDQFEGYGFGMLHESLAFLDAYRGLMPRWEIHFKFAMLRMVSFNMDYYWACRGDYQPLPTKNTDPERLRIQTSRKTDEYNYLNYTVYMFYVPLFIAGPIITFNNFVAQMHHRPASIKYRDTIIYALRVFGAMFLMDAMMHYIYVVTISKSHAWAGLSAFEISMVGYFNLKYIWLKLLVIWRFFRLWAMADGIEVTENMNRCMSNNYSAQGFWRSWHRSYNRWLIRYVYIPMGGSKYAIYNMWPVFTFVAVWHDVSFKLLAWAWLICLFILPEIILTRLTRPYQNWRYYRHLCAVGGVGNLLMMATANLVGFAVGVDGMQEMFRLILTPSGVTFLVVAPFALFGAVQLMFEVRESEKRRGVAAGNY